MDTDMIALSRHDCGGGVGGGFRGNSGDGGGNREGDVSIAISFGVCLLLA